MTPISTPKQAKLNVPLKKVANDDIGEILLGNDSRLLLIVGPCSIHNIECAMEYAKRLRKLALEVEDVFHICMRTYFEKPRTLFGWKGLLYDPFLDGSNCMDEGIRLARTLLSYLADLGLDAATEFLEPLSSFYLADGIAWGSVGARTCQSPIHRQIASSLKMPIGFKNPIDGNIEVAIQACLASREAQSFLGIDDNGRVSQVRGEGNRFAHVVLRGSDKRPNYDRPALERVLRRLSQTDLLEAIIVDCSHDNSEKNYLKQPAVFSTVINEVASGNSAIRGIMLESFLQAGSQGVNLSKEFGQSITDPCLDWETTQMLIRQGAHLLRQKALSCV